MLVHSGRFLKQVVGRFWRLKGTDAVGILAYTSLLGIVPMLAVMLSIFSTSAWFSPFQEVIMQFVVAHLMPDSQPVIQNYLTLFAQQATRLAAPGLVVMFVTTLMLLWTIDKKINDMWETPNTRVWWMSWLNYLGVSVLGPLLLGLSLVATTYILAAPLWKQDAWLSHGASQLLRFMPLGFSIVGFMLLYRWVPQVKVRWYQAWWVAVMAALQLEALKWAFALYVKLFPTYDVVYGALAAVPLFLLWLYLIWFIVIWNACVLSVWTQPQAPKARKHDLA
jgi:membrane protein